MSLTKTIHRLLHEIAIFGVGAAIRNACRELGSGIFSKKTYAVEIPEFGSILIRRRDSDYYTILQTFSRHEYLIIEPIQERIFKRYRQILDEGNVPIVIDAGANIGTAAIWFQSIYPKARILAVEPDPGNVKILEKNVSAYPLITILTAAVGSRLGFVSLVDNEQSWAIRTERAESGCRVVTIGQAIKTVPNGVLLLAKIDIEGFEKDLFAENLEWINQVFAVFIEPHDWLFPGKQISCNFQRALGKGDFELFLNGGENLLYVRAAPA